MRLTAPSAIPDDAPRPWVFLSGPIDRGLFGGGWRARVARALADREGLLIDLTRRDWAGHWDTDDSAEPFRSQVLWELAALERADRILCCFTTSSPAPVSLLEFGLYAKSGRLDVVCPRRYRNAGHVRLVAQAAGAALYDDLASWIEAARDQFP
ncbi:MAG: nucleoside 2-deoxyribosyltransferase domain-containing protein [Parvularculaceae bacterium]|nr:nucleoside 2-deoxyribosyltransferase domain-containing protein [Parvularculaceae bacterium]